MEKKTMKNDKALKDQKGLQTAVVREFEPADKPDVQRIFYEGVIEMIPNIAFRGLRHHPESLLLYTAMTGLVPAIVLCGRYFYSRRAIHGYLEHAMNGDMGDIEGFYTKSSDSCLWVAVLEGKVVGVVAAVGQQKPGGAVELKRMSVDRSCRQRGVGLALGRKVLEFAVTHRYSFVVLGTTAYTQAPHQLYQRLGFQCVGVTIEYVTPGANTSLLEQIFYRVRRHHYRLHVQNSKIT